MANSGRNCEKNLQETWLSLFSPHSLAGARTVVVTRWQSPTPAGAEAAGAEAAGRMKKQTMLVKELPGVGFMEGRKAAQGLPGPVRHGKQSIIIENQ
jgi:hypothetical protein